MRSVFLTSDGNILKEGDVYKHPLLAQTLEQIAQKVQGYTGCPNKHGNNLQKITYFQCSKQIFDPKNDFACFVIVLILGKQNKQKRIII